MNIPINIPDGMKGKWEIKTFTLTDHQADMHNLSESRGLERYIVAGVPYKSLLRYDIPEPGYAGTIVMTNTPAEVIDILPFVEKASGDILIFGLGMGMVVQALLEKEDIKTITIVEIDHELIELVGFHYSSQSSKIKVIQGDAFEYYDKNRYNAIWFDIWDTIDEENLQEMKRLKKRWSKNSPIRLCWSKKECRILQRVI